MDRAKLELALQSYADAKSRHDLDAAIAACAPDCYYESVGLGQRVTGREALRQFYAGLFKALPDYYGTFSDVTYGNDTAVAVGHFGGTLSGDLMGMRVEAGRRLHIPVTFVCKFREDGLLVSDVGYFDAATYLAQAGLVPSSSKDAAAAADFVQRFKSFWAAPSGARSAEIIHANAKIHWPGATMSGSELVPYFDNVLRVARGMTLEVSDYAFDGSRVYIHWQARVPAGDRTYSWVGVDRFVLQDGKAIEEHVIFDMAGLRSALQPVAA